ncbi:DUF3080 family protein [Algiphilus sp.]|uniref:DUF3080 family protein n=1 Tax=Algiphilus sp. TaxID=1872431 RepID=UPI003B52BF24
MSKLCCLLAIILLGLHGCTPDPGDALFARYLEALAHATESTGEADAIQRSALPPRYPRARQRTAEVPEVRGGVLELFSLSRCDVTQFIAQRNSILGRHADSASHVALGSAVMARLQECRRDLEAEDELHDRLDTLIEEKRPALQALRWNASFGSAAFAQWWSLATQPVVPEAQTHNIAAPVDTLLQAISAARDGEVAQAQAAFSSAYQRFEQSRGGGAWLLAAQRAVWALERAQPMLVAATASGICHAEREGAWVDAEQLYRTRVGPHVQLLARAMREASTPLEQLWTAQSAEMLSFSQSVADFRNQVWHGPESLAHTLGDLQRRHDALWQARRTACDD